MSTWNTVDASKVKDTLACPQCRRELQFGAPLVVPELIKCQECKTEFCLIVRHDRRYRPATGQKLPQPEAPCPKPLNATSSLK